MDFCTAICNCIFLVNSNIKDVIIDECSIQNSGTGGSPGTGTALPVFGSGGHGISIQPGVSVVQIINCKLEHVGGASLSGGDGIRVVSAGTGESGLTFDIQILNNKLLLIGGTGISLRNSVPATIGPQNCQVIGNIIESVGGVGIDIASFDSTVIVVSNRVNISDIGINNNSVIGTIGATFANNLVANNNSADYAGAVQPSSIRFSDPLFDNQDIGYWANVRP